MRAAKTGPAVRALKVRIYAMERELSGLTKRRIPRLQKELRGAKTRAAELKREIRAAMRKL